MSFVLLLQSGIQSKRGFTIIELIASIAIFSILVTLAAYCFTPALNAVQAIQCSSRIRSIHTALASRLAEHGAWPQPPETLHDEDVEDWWINQLLPFGIAAKTWLCPTTHKIFIKKPESSPKSSFAVSAFDKSPTAPYKWPQQPWLIEIVGVHPQGPHICFPDGSVKNLNQLLKK